MHPTKEFGLPNAADLLKFAALQKITQAQKTALGGKLSTEVPILFSTRGSDQITVEIQHKLGANLLVSPLPSSLDIPRTGPPLRGQSSDSSLTSSPSPG